MNLLCLKMVSPLAPGFCNVNNLFELNLEQAQAIEVWRGPASAVLGGNALHGAINVISPVPERTSLGIEVGNYDFARVNAAGGFTRGDHTVGASIVGTTTNGYRDSTGYGQQKSLAHLTEVSGWAVKNQFTATLLNQETGAYVRGLEAYEDPDLRSFNPNPRRFRAVHAGKVNDERPVDAQALSSALENDFFTALSTGSAIMEKNDQTSGGLIVDYAIDAGATRANVGGQVELMSGALNEFQDGPTVGSASSGY